MFTLQPTAHKPYIKKYDIIRTLGPQAKSIRLNTDNDVESQRRRLRPTQSKEKILSKAKLPPRDVLHAVWLQNALMHILKTGATENAEL